MNLFSKKIALISALAILLVTIFFDWGKLVQNNSVLMVRQEIPQGSTFSVLAIKSGLATSTANEIIKAAQPIYDLAMISAGKDLVFEYDKKLNNLQKMKYDINNSEQLIVSWTATSSGKKWVAEKAEISYATEVASEKGIIEESLYKTVVSQGLDQRLALALAEMFAWQIDFAGEIQKGDSFKIIYEKKYRDGKYDHPGNILAAEFINAGEKYQGFYFSGAQTKEGYYDDNGNSLQKVFLKAPLQYKYISSGYTYRRFNEILGKTTPHRGIDYAAAQGTPAVSVGDGTVIQAGWNGQYGISVKVRHNDTYATVYGHFMSLAKGITVGAKIRQGQIVGYVGSTGLSTGPHLHYEMHKFGAFINPFTEKVPSIEPVNGADRIEFEKVKSEYQMKFQKIIQAD